MTKKLYTLLTAITLFTLVVSAQEPVITMTTTTKGTPLTLRINGTIGSSVTIDFGTGGIITDVLSGENTNKDITSPKSLTDAATVVKIYGTNITGFRPYNINVIALDISKCIGLTYLDARSNQLTSLDVTKNLALKVITVIDNLITTINVSNNPELNYLHFNNNKITNIDVSNNPVLNYLQLGNNNLTFATLPQRKSTYITYDYEPQAALELPKTNYNTIEEVDLSSQLTAIDINGVSKTTTYTWKSETGTLLIAGTDYTGTGGKFKFLKAMVQPVYCEMTNPAFSYLTLSTSKFTVELSVPVITMTTTSTGSPFTVSIRGTVGTTATIDFGNGGTVTKQLSGESSDVNFTSPSNLTNASTVVKVYGNSVIGFNSNSKMLTSLDVSKATNLLQLICSNNKLTIATLPQRKNTYAIYTYAPQVNFALPQSTYSTLDAVDLSSQLSAKDINGVSKTTSYTWKSETGTLLVAGTDYTGTGGKFTFLKAINQLVYCEMTNPAFPDLTLSTGKITIALPAPVITMTTTSTGAPFTVSISGIAGTSAMVDFGSGGTVTKQLSGESLDINFTSPNSLTNASTQVKVYGSSILSFSGNSNKLTSLDVSKALNLKRLNCFNNDLTTINLISNINLSRLDCNWNKLTSLDLSKNLLLTYLDCNLNKITGLIITTNTALTYLNCSWNQLTTLNLTKNVGLDFLSCGNNQLTQLDVKLNTLLTSLYCDINKLTFVTLPQRKSSYTEYSFSNQGALVLPQSNYATLEEVDLSSQLTAKDINGVSQPTTYIWKTENGGVPVAANNYYVTGGKFTFVKAITEPIFCEMVNPAFPDLTLSTSTIKVALSAPAITMTTTTTGKTLTIYIAGTNGKYATVDFGAAGIVTLPLTGVGNLKAFTSTVALTATATNIKVYGTAITNLSVNTSKLTALNVQSCPTLVNLACSVNDLTELDVTNNSLLESISCSQNKLQALNVTKNLKIELLTCSNNKLTTLDVTKNTLLKQLLCDYNSIVALDVSKNILLNKLSCGNNKVNLLDVTKNSALSSFDCSSNNLNFATLPQPKSSYSDYDYRYQNYLLLPTKTLAVGESVDLSNQLKAKAANGAEQTTTYKWKTANNVTLIAGVDYTEVAGVFTFNKAFSDSIHCEMVNSAFPLITNSTPLSTKNILVYMLEPVITMTTTCSGTPLTLRLNGIEGSFVTIDFGSGGIVTSQLLGININKDITSPANLSGASTEVKVYGSSITGFRPYNIKVTSMDISKCAGLTYLDVRSNQLTTLDVSNNIAMKAITCNNNMISSLDVSKNPALNYLHCNNNKITTIDVSNNLDLTSLDCSYNQIKAVDLKNNTTVTSVILENNLFTYATLPQCRSNTTYSYAPQGKLTLPKKTYATLEAIDLSSEISAKDLFGASQTTTYSWYTKVGAALTRGTDFTETNGITTFVRAPADSVFCRMSNTAYPNFDTYNYYWFVTETIKVNAPNGIDESENNSINIYVSQGHVVVDKLTGGEKIQVVDIVGRVIAEIIATNSTERIQLPIRGLFVVRVNQHTTKIAW